ncbi:TonB-dependent receptor [Novosphingobium sp. CECT 9465]|uniref:TonB-dependent receptor n=1 Tax=Novosphingobium sp. CECT 9465 TaxID=2829794 RepID=UPI001E3912A4|nr:TonB-dependent receptor [Novosphingobium sp. CECT 9465]CAH0496142.1 Vitamin B12 transporter BtuB [Novosphingobium sp. CECT 9465]
MVHFSDGVRAFGARKCALLRGGASTFAVIVAALATPVLAQAAQEQVPEEVSLQDIVVTAQRREERLSKVPVSVVAYGAEALQTRNIASEQDVGTLVPGLQVKNGQNSNQLSYSMRGQSLDPFSGTSPAVLPYLNEAPYNPGNTATAFFDLGSIQVLKGPQGTLFGRNATGGAVLYTTPMPGDEFGGYVILRGASREFGQMQAAVDLPIVTDKLAIRLAFDATRGNGYVTNINTGNTLGDKNSRSGRATILFTPTETIRNVTVFQHDRVRGTEGVGGIFNYHSVPTTPGDPTTQFISDGTTKTPNTTGILLDNTLAAIYGNNDGPAAPGFFPGGVEGYTKFSRANPYKIFLQYDLPHRAENTFVSNTTEIEVGSYAKIKNIFSYMKGNSRTPGNLGGGPFGSLWLFKLAGTNATGAPGGQTFKSETYSNELQLQGETADGKLNYTAGVFYSNQKRFEIIPINIGADVVPGGIADISYAYRNRQTSKAVFAQVSYKVTDKLTATLGGRYTWETVGIRQAAGNVFGVDPNSPAADQSQKLSAPAWTASVQYQIDPNNMVYFNQRGSFRSGNLNGTVAPFTDPLTGKPANLFKNEKVHDFEIGYKFNGRISTVPVQFNVAAYKIIVKDAQRALYAVVGGAPAGFTVNVPEAVTKGVEVDAFVGLTSWLDVGFNLAYTDAKYTKRNVPIPFVGNIAVDSYPDAPKWAGSGFAELKFPVPSEIGGVSLRADYYKQSSFFFSNTNGTSTPGTGLDGYSTLAMRLNWKEIMESQVSAALFVRNLTKNTYYISGYALGASNGVNTAYPGEPRTFGAELSVKF